MEQDIQMERRSAGDTGQRKGQLDSASNVVLLLHVSMIHNSESHDLDSWTPKKSGKFTGALAW